MLEIIVVWFDPICQSFMVDQVNGIFVSSIEVFFATKSSALPVTLQIRTMTNGYSTTTVLPFAEKTIDVADITVSTDASERLSLRSQVLYSYRMVLNMRFV